MNVRTLVLAGVTLALAAAPLRGDVDVLSPPGRPLEWERNLARPVPTDRGQIPPKVPLEPDHAPPAVPPTRPNIDPGKSQVMEPPPGIRTTLRTSLRPVISLYGYFNVSTPDLPAHLELGVNTPNGQPASPRVLTPTSPDALELKYPPDYPPELVWDAACTIMRITLHPEANPETECLVHAIALGDPAARGAELVRREPPANTVTRYVGTMPNSAPGLPSFRGTPYEAMLLRLAVLEMSNGFAYALDPNYCRRTLAVGTDMVPALIACSTSSHPLLRRNATALLGAYAPYLTADALKARLKDTDVVVRLRALRGIGEQRDIKALKTLLTVFDTAEPVEEIMAIQSVGLLGDSTVLPELRKRFEFAKSKPDLLGPYLAAVIRTGGDDAVLRNRIKELAQDLFQNFPTAGSGLVSRSNYGTPPTGEPFNFHNRLLWELAQFALAAIGDKDVAKRVLTMKPEEVHPSNVFHWCEAISQVGGDGALFSLRQIIDQSPEPLVRLHAMNLAFNISADPFWLQRMAVTGPNFPLRAQALTLLATISPAMAKITCAELIRVLPRPDVNLENPLAKSDLFTRTQRWAHDMARVGQPQNVPPSPTELAYATPESAAHFLQVLLSVGSQLGAFKFHELEPWVRSLYRGQFRARRVGTSALEEIPSVTLFPPTMETAILEFGRGGDTRALPLLIEILNSGKAIGPAEAAVALGNLPCRPAAAALIQALNDADGWTRFCAYRALKAMSGKDFLADWLFGAAADRGAAVQRYAAWLKDAYPE